MFIWTIVRRKNKRGFVSARFIILKITSSIKNYDPENDDLLTDMGSDNDLEDI